ncbi:MAG: hypothetical protein NZ455_15235 [Bacteroidia bacterium]|nr:hypothetical protein [Bacteroidia bacterium]
MIKSFIAYYIVNLQKCNKLREIEGIIAVKEGDTNSYIEPIENLITKGEYYFTYKAKFFEEKLYASRLPHYGLIFGFFRLFFSHTASCNLLVLLQILLEATSVLLISLLCFEILGSYIFFWISWFLLNLNLSSVFWSIAILPESLSISFLTFVVYFTYKYEKTKENKFLMYSSIFLSILVCLKPYFLPIYLYYPISFLLQKEKITIRKFTYKSFLLVLPLIVLLAPWIIRNYYVLNKFIFLQQDMLAGYKFTKTHIAMGNFVKSWGGDNVYWEVTSPSHYFLYDDDYSRKYQFPSYAFCSAYNADTLANLRKEVLKFYAKNQYDEQLDNYLASKFNFFTESFKSENFFHYQFIARLLTLKGFLLHSGSYFLPINKNLPCYKSYQFLLKVMQSAIYYLFLVVGSIGLITMFLKKEYYFSPLVLILLSYVIFFFAFYLRTYEWRYIWTVFPLLCVGLLFMLNSLVNLQIKIKK